jgi:hypothetical protein
MCSKNYDAAGIFWIAGNSLLFPGIMYINRCLASMHCMSGGFKESHKQDS